VEQGSSGFDNADVNPSVVEPVNLLAPAANADQNAAGSGSSIGNGPAVDRPYGKKVHYLKPKGLGSAKESKGLLVISKKGTLGYIARHNMQRGNAARFVIRTFVGDDKPFAKKDLNVVGVSPGKYSDRGCSFLDMAYMMATTPTHSGNTRHYLRVIVNGNPGVFF